MPVRRVKRFACLTVCMSLLCGCGTSSSSQEDLRDEVRNIETTSVWVELTASDEGDSSEPYETTSLETISLVQQEIDFTISDNLLILDDSGGTASVYLLRYDEKEEPVQGNSEWKASILLDQYVCWFIGMPVEISRRYFPPEDIWKETIATWREVSVDDIKGSEDLPDIENRRGHVIGMTFDLGGYPEETEMALDYSFSSEMVDYYGVPYRIDGIPVGGSGFTHAPIYLPFLSWEGVFTDTPDYYEGYASGLYDFVCSDTVAKIGVLPKYTILDTISEDAPLVDAEKALEAVEESVRYRIYNRSVVEIYVFAMELAYVCVKSYDLETKSTIHPDEAITVPVWVIYFYAKDSVNNPCIDTALINAVTGESIYSKYYYQDDPRIFDWGG